MKASVQLREGERPLVRAKIPLSILGLPFMSGVNAGSSSELCLHLATLWEAGPALKLAYRPNDSWNPFSLILKTGTGEWGSPMNAAMTMRAELSLLGNGSPSFCLHFRPRLGDFTLRQSARSAFAVTAKNRDTGPELHSGFPNSEVGPISNGDFGKKLVAMPNGAGTKENSHEDDRGGLAVGPSEFGAGFSEKPQKGQFLESLRAIRVENFFGDLTLTALTSMPVRKHALVKLRWGLKVPSELLRGDRHAGFSLSKLPFLCLEKISVENVEQLKNARNGLYGNLANMPGEDMGLPLNREEAEALTHIRGMCYSMRKHLHMLQAENRVLKKAIEDMGTELQHRAFGGQSRSDSSTARPAFNWSTSEEESVWKEPWESSYKENNFKKADAREASKKDANKAAKNGSSNKRSAEASAADVSEELKKAIRGASGNLGDK